ncbi:STAS domain-containing protein [Bacillus dakarensis]|uniref:STAS domain-containing protein n=1 Tax=Robertmurraya dakarensis TaxID=1926278 RepID=UPI00098156E7|nr:STAS domain-containing protein [Bacillus dakarensis]
MSLKVKKEIQGLTTIFTLQGVLDISTSGVIDDYLENIGTVKTLVIDFSKLEFIDSTGIGSIMNAIYLSQEKQFRLELQGVDELTNEVFETVGLYQILNTLQLEGV